MLKRFGLISVFLILTVLFSACGSDDKKSPTDASTAKKITQTQAQVNYTRPGRKITTTAPASTTKKTTAATTKAATTAAPDITFESTTSVQYKTTSEIVNYYNSCINKVKTGAKSVTKNYEQILSLENNITSGEVTSTLISSYFNKGRDGTPAVYSTYDEKVANFPVAGKNYSSRLEPDMVKSASCTYKNDKYNIVINLKDDTQGQNYASTCLSTVSAEWVSNTCNGLIDKEKMTLNCKDCVIKCAVNAKTNDVVSLNTYMPTVVHLTAFEENQSFSFYIKQDWTVSW